MAARSIPKNPLRILDLPLFLAPALADIRTVVRSKRSFSSSSAQCERQNREKNKQRGVSAIRSTGPRVPLKVNKYPLPVPVENPDRRKKFKTTENHGLWGFFNEEKKAMVSPEEEASHGRPWTYQELSVKDWEDLYKLYWTCVMERNRVATRAHEMHRLKAGYGENEVDSRLKVVQNTMKNIRAVLRDRHINYTEARTILEENDDARELLADPEEDEAEFDPYSEVSDQQELPDQVHAPDLVTEPPPPPLQPTR